MFPMVSFWNVCQQVTKPETTVQHGVSTSLSVNPLDNVDDILVQIPAAFVATGENIYSQNMIFIEL